GPTRAIRCALAVVAAVGGLGIQLRGGLHTGECELLNSAVGGVALRLAARVMALARPGELVVSSTVRDLVAGSGFDFEEQQPPVVTSEFGTYRIFRVRSP